MSRAMAFCISFGIASFGCHGTKESVPSHAAPRSLRSEIGFAERLSRGLRYLEDLGSERTLREARQENDATAAAFRANPDAGHLEQRTRELAVGPRRSSYETVGTNKRPVAGVAATAGCKPWLFTKREGVEWRCGSKSHIVLEPSRMADHEVALEEAELSPGARYVLAKEVIDGHDIGSLLVREVDPNGEPLGPEPERIRDIENVSIVWDEKRGGLFYHQTPRDVPHAIRFGASTLSFHTVGNREDKDRRILDALHEPNAMSSNVPLGLTREQRLLIVRRGGWDNTLYGTVDLEGPAPRFVPLVDPDGVIEQARVEEGHVVYVVRTASERRIKRIAVNGQALTLRKVPHGAGYIDRQERGEFRILNFGKGANQSHEVADSDYHTLDTWNLTPGERATFYALGTPKTVRVLIESLVRAPFGVDHRPRDRKVVLRELAEPKIDPDQFQIDALEAETSDGERVPFEVLRLRSTPLNGQAPAWVHAYAGFQGANFWGYAPGPLAWVEKGGIFVLAHPRGGVEKGRDWNKAALRKKHFLSVSDLGACLLALQQRNYTSPDRTLIHGKSHGGWLASRTGIAYPDRVAAVLAEVPLVDMIRYAEFGRGGVTEYGDPNDPEERVALEQISTLENIQEGTRYPAFFVTVAIHDERVHASHGLKLVQALRQAHPANEVHLRVHEKGGHLRGGGDDYERPKFEALGWLIGRVRRQQSAGDL